jgi:WD40 repeat protein
MTSWFALPFALFACVLVTHADEIRLVQSIPLGNIEGRIDHMAYDAQGKRLFICALGNNTVEVVDLQQGRVVESLAGLSEPQGVAFIPELNLFAVANGGDGRVVFFDGKSFTAEGYTRLEDDADNMRYDAAHKSIIVGYGGGSLATIDTTTRKVTADLPLHGHPESFQLDASGSRIYVNVPDAHTVSIVDTAQKKVSGEFSLGLAAANFPMAFDPSHHRLFIGCRLPARLLVFNTDTGGKVATLILHGDCDDVFYDPAQKKVYASCGEGFLDIFTQADADHYSLKQSEPTADGARTSFFDGGNVYIAIPHRGQQPAELRIYR